MGYFSILRYGLLGVRKMNKVSNARIRELCGKKKGVDKKTDEGVLLWFGHVEGREKDTIAKRVHVGECAGSHLVGRPRKKWNDIMKGCLKKSLDVSQARRMVYNRRERLGFGGSVWEVARGMNP